MSYSSTLHIAIDSTGAEQQLRRFQNRLELTEHAGNDTASSVKNVDVQIAQMQSTIMRASGIISGGAAALGLMARQSSDAAREIKNLSRLAGADVVTFQKMTMASRAFGIEQEQLAQIMLDVKDRVGDFLQTGQGEFADFFENIAPKVGLTADALARMAGPEALQAIYNALEQTNLTASETTFYMESLASDATRLIPLLKDNGAGFREVAVEAERLGVALSEVEIDQLTALRGEFADLETIISSSTSQLIAEYSGEITSTVDALGDGVRLLADNFDTLQDTAALAAGVMTGRFVSAMAAGTVAIGQKTLATINDIRQTALADAQEQGRIATLARRQAAESTAAANQARIAAQKASLNRQEAAEDVARLQRWQAQLSAERALEVQRMKAQISQTGRLQSQARLVELRTAEIATANQLTASTARLAEAEIAESSATRASTLATVESTRADQVATAAKGRYTASVGASTAANTSAKVAARALGGALSLVGGPLGAAVIAASAIYHFREELGLTQQAIGYTEQELVSLRQEMADMDGVQITQTLSQVEDALFQVGLKAAAAREELAQLRSESGGSGFLGFEGGRVGEEIRGMQAVAEYTEKMTELEQKRAVMQEELTSRTEEGTVAMDDMTVTAARLTGETESLGKAAGETAEKTTTLADAYESLLDRIQPNRRAARQYAQDVGTLNLALATGRMNTTQYMQAMGMLQESFQAAQRDSTDLSDTVTDGTDEMTRQMERFGNSVDDAFVDAFRGAFDSFEDFADRIGDAFENLLAELAYAALKNEIKIQLGMGASGPMPGGLGQLFSAPSGGGFNLSSLGSLKNGWDTVSGLFGGGSAASGGLYANALTGSAAAGGLYAGASTGAAVGGLYGNALTGAATTASGGFMSAVGSAMPWIGAGLLVDNLLGLGITDGIVEGISSIFGGGKSDPRLNISTRGDAGQFSHESVRTGAFGAVGFSEGTKRSNDLFGSVEQEREWLASVAALDNLTAAAARTPEQLDAMTSAVQNMVLTSGDAQGAIDQLAGRTAAATRVLDAELTQTLLDAGASAEQIAQRFATARNAVDLITAASERLNLQYDANADGALRYADSLVQAYGSVESITAIQDAYYNAAFSDQERLQNQYDDVRSALNGLTDEAPRTVAELRALVEAQQLNGGASQQLAYDLMALAPALAETNAAVRRAIEQQYQESLGRAPEAAGLEYWFNQVASGSATLERALSAIAASSEAAQYAAGDTAESIDLATAAREYERDALAAANRVQQERVRAIEQEARAMMSAGGNIRQFVESLQNTAGAGLSPETAYQNAEESFLAAISTIYTSDDSSLVQDTISGITGIAQEYLAAAEAYGASGSIYQQAQALVEGSLDDLAGRLGSDELEDIDPQLQAMVDQLKNVAANTGLAGPLAKQVPLAQTFSEFFGGSGSQNYMYRQLGALAGIEAAIRDTAAKAVEESTPQGRTLSVSQAAAALRGSGNSQLASLFNSSKTVAQHAGNLEYNLGGLLNGESRGLVDTVTARTIANALDFDESRYFTLNEDVAAAVARGEFASGLQHFVSHGLQEGRKFAKGGVFTNSIVSSPTLFDMGLMGESGDEAIMPLTRHRNGSLGVRAELPPMPQFPALGRSDVLQVLQDVRRELVETRQQNQRLQEENNQHAAAAVAVQQEGFRQQISEQKKGNDALGAMASKARLEGSR